jgi:biopolymer transport protein ExbD
MSVADARKTGAGMRHLRAGRTARPGRRREADLTSLINIVFLILIFFVVAGAIRPFAARDIDLAKVARDDVGVTGSSVLVVHRDGRIQYRGRFVDIDTLSDLMRERTGQQHGADQSGETFTIVADAHLPASRLLEVSRAVQAAGIASVALMVERTAR